MQDLKSAQSFPHPESKPPSATAPVMQPSAETLPKRRRPFGSKQKQAFATQEPRFRKNAFRKTTPRSISWGLALGGILVAIAAVAGSMSFGWQGGVAIAVSLLALALNAFTRLPTEAVFLGGLAVLLVSGVLSTEEALAGFSNPGMVTIAVLYVVIAGVQQTGGLIWISQYLLGLPKGLTAAMVRLIFPVVGMSAFLNNTPVVAMFVPVVSDWARKLRISPSKLMIPLSYAAIFGGVCTLIGTSTNLVVNGLLIEHTGGAGLSMFDITRVSFPCAVVGCIYLLTAGRWLLPSRKGAISEQDDVRQYTVEMVVASGSPLSGKTIQQAGLRNLPGLYLGKIIRDGRVFPAVGPQERLREADQLVFMGMVDSIVDLKKMRGLQPATDQIFKLEVDPTERCLVEAVVSNTCPIRGQTIRAGRFRKRYSAVVLAVARNGERLQGKIGDIRLQAGDSLLLEAHPSFLDTQRDSRDFYLISGVPNSEPLRHQKAPLALGILVAMVGLVTLTPLSMLHAAVLAALLMVVTQCCAVDRALRGIEWPVLLVIAAALSMGKALEVTGAASGMAELMMGFAGTNPWLALALIYGVTMVLTEAITNNAAAALVFPIALAVSQNLGVDFMPFAIAIMIAASASFATPIGYQTNLMVYGPGGYRFSDFIRVGLPLNMIFWLITVLLTPKVFPF